jgi:hypothetical protein
VDAVVTKSLTGHVTEQMREHYSSVDLAEKRVALAGVARLVRPEWADQWADSGPSRVFSDEAGNEKASDVGGLLERETGLEPATFSLGNSWSVSEIRQVGGRTHPDALAKLVEAGSAGKVVLRLFSGEEATCSMRAIADGCQDCSWPGARSASRW